MSFPVSEQRVAGLLLHGQEERPHGEQEEVQSERVQAVPPHAVGGKPDEAVSDLDN